MKQSNSEIATLENTIPVFQGRTPFSYWGSWPTVLFSLFSISANCYSETNEKQARTDPFTCMIFTM